MPYNESNFLHDISNSLATAQISLEILCESLGGNTRCTTEELETANAALIAVKKVCLALENRRNEFREENNTPTKDAAKKGDNL